MTALKFPKRAYAPQLAKSRPIKESSENLGTNHKLPSATLGFLSSLSAIGLGAGGALGGSGFCLTIGGSFGGSGGLGGLKPSKLAMFTHISLLRLVGL